MKNSHLLGLSAADLYSGCILASVVHSVMMTKMPVLAHENSWAKINNNLQNSMGARGTVTFHPNVCVAAFFESRSSRNAYLMTTPYILENYLDGVPALAHNTMQENALRYLIQDYNGLALPIVTTVFWQEGNDLVSYDSREIFFENGGHLVEIQFHKIESAISEWEEEYEMSATTLALAKRIYNQKIGNSSSILELSKSDTRMLLDEVESSVARRECENSLSEIGIILSQSYA